MRREFRWQRLPSCPPGLPLHLLQEGDCRALAATVSCGQHIAGDGAFSLGMIADYIDSLTTYGAAFYRNLFWEAGMVGQVLYLEAEEVGIRSTGIGCYFDDPVHEVFGIASREWQSFYHFTVGGALEDTRLTTLPAYDSIVEHTAAGTSVRGRVALTHPSSVCGRRCRIHTGAGRAAAAPAGATRRSAGEQPGYVDAVRLLLAAGGRVELPPADQP